MPDPDAEQCAGDAVVPTVTVTRNGEEIAGLTWLTGVGLGIAC